MQISRLITPVLLILLVGLSYLSATISCSDSDFMFGTVLNTPEPAYQFELIDQFGQDSALSDYTGRVVVLTFLYTKCQDVCPIVTRQLWEVFQLLDDVSNQVMFLAITVDPQRDTTLQIHKYSMDWDMLEKWKFLTGNQTDLESVWEAYYVASTIYEDTESSAVKSRKSESSKGALNALSRATQAAYKVKHPTPVYLIDRAGLKRVLFTQPLQPDRIAHDVRMLLKSG